MFSMHMVNLRHIAALSISLNHNLYRSDSGMLLLSLWSRLIHRLLGWPPTLIGEMSKCQVNMALECLFCVASEYYPCLTGIQKKR